MFMNQVRMTRLPPLAGPTQANDTREEDLA